MHRVAHLPCPIAPQTGHSSCGYSRSQDPLDLFQAPLPQAWRNSLTMTLYEKASFKTFVGDP